MYFTGQLAAVSNREDVELFYSLIDEDTGDATDLTDATIVVEVQDQNGSIMWDGSTTDGDITLPEDTVMRILIPRSSMTAFCAGTYKVGMTVENFDITQQAIIGTLAVSDGGVPA